MRIFRVCMLYQTSRPSHGTRQIWTPSWQTSQMVSRGDNILRSCIQGKCLPQGQTARTNIVGISFQALTNLPQNLRGCIPTVQATTGGRNIRPCCKADPSSPRCRRIPDQTSLRSLSHTVVNRDTKGCGVSEMARMARIHSGIRPSVARYNWPPRTFSNVQST